MHLRFGLASWTNVHHDHGLYALGTPHRARLPLYASMFPVVEADILHHRFIEEGDLRSWVQATPETFRFLPKLHKLVTHGAYDDVALSLVESATEAWRVLNEADRLGPGLVQFPARFERTDDNMSWLEALLDALGPFRVAVEFRDKSWFDETIERLLAQRGIALAWSTFDAAKAPPWFTADFGYVRFVGTCNKRRGRWVKQRERVEDLLDMRARVLDEAWEEAFVVVTNRFEGNAIDSLPGVAAALGQRALAERCLRAPMAPLLS